MIYNIEIINTFNTIKLNHKPSVRNSGSKKRKKHVQDIIKRRKQYKDAKTIIIDKNGNIKRTYF